MGFRQSTTVANDAWDVVYLADGVFAIAGAVAIGVRTGDNGTPYLTPPPWYQAPPAVSAFRLRGEMITSAAATVNVTLRCLSAPPGVFRRLYG